MPLNIKNERVTELAAQLAQMTGQSITDAVGGALEAKIEAVRAEQSKAQRLQRAREIVEEISPILQAHYGGRNPLDDLYDENGLPR
jgi:antitoxin VapB